MTDPSQENNSAASDNEPKKERENALLAFDVLGKFLESDGWHPQRMEGKNVYSMLYSGKHGELRCFCQIRMDLEQFIFYAVSPIKAGEEVRGDVAEFLTRANYGLRIGNFEMDYGDGEVRYKCSLDFEGTELVPPFIRNIMYASVQTMDHYLVGLMRVIFGGATPKEAIEEVEGN